jgi:hypothetical protein
MANHTAGVNWWSCQGQFTPMPSPFPIFPHYGPWTADPDNLKLTHKDGHIIDLSLCRNSARMLYYIYTTFNAKWATATDIYHLIQALDDIFYPLNMICPGGSPRTASHGHLLGLLSRLQKAKENWP